MAENYIKGQFRKSIFTSENGYTIGIFKVSDTGCEDFAQYQNKTITFIGYFHELNEVDIYKFYGKIVNHVKYGEQFQVEKYERCMPEEKDSMISFLSSGLFKGIGEAKAEKIVKTLGKDTFQVILENPANLILIPGITEANSKILHNRLLEYEASYEIIIKLTEMGFSTKDSMIVYNKYKNKTLDTINNNIYLLVEDINDLTYKKIDLIALKQGIKQDDDIRIDASILYILRTLTNTLGHSYYSYDEIFSYIPRVLGVLITEDKFIERLNYLESDFKIKVIDDRYYLFDIYEAEKLVVRRFNLLQHKKDNSYKNIDDEINYIEDYFNISYNDDQELAIKEAICKNVLVITGGPGTGKTTILKAILELYKNINKFSYKDLEDDIALLAPTGRASKRMSEATLFKASTIHRFLKWNKENDTFQINEYNKSKVKFVIIDEASMIDIYLFSNLLKGLSVNTKIILIGDYEQLPSVGAGQVLNDIINSSMINTIYLTKLYRQENDSNILNLAYDIRNDSLKKDIFNITDDLTFIECLDSEVINNLCILASSYKDYNSNEFQVLAPMYKTYNGIDNINNHLQNIFNEKVKNKKEIVIDSTIFREGDKVIQLTNMPDDNVYNGDIGIISRIDIRPKKEVYIDFSGNIVKYTPSNFYNFKLAYAISIHKSQGSEFDIVIIPIVKGYKKMLYKKLIYTGITRAKKKLFLVGDFTALEIAVKNVAVGIRRTTIKELLTEGINE